MERGSKASTLEDVARAAGVSRSTVSRVVNSDPAVTPTLRIRVQHAIDRLGYRPDAAARALASGRTDVVHLVVFGTPAGFGGSPYHARVVAGVLTALDGTGAEMRLRVVPVTEAGRVLTEVTRRPGLGVIAVDVPADLAAELTCSAERLVILGRSSRAAWVDPDNITGARTAVRHLYSAGRRSIAAIHGPQQKSCAIGRRDGYNRAMTEIGLQPVSVGGGFCHEAGLHGTRHLLATRPDIDAIFAACDATAIGALHALYEGGRRVPDDVAVVGFDDSVLATSSTPPLSSVCQPVEEIAATATRALLDRQVSPDWHRELPTELVVRQSSAA